MPFLVLYMEVFKIEKYQVKVNNTTINVDSLSFEFAQQDSESSGRSEDLTMYRDVLGLINKISCGFEFLQGNELSTILNIVKHIKSASVTYVDPTDGVVTKNMYVAADTVKVKLLNGEYVSEPFEIRFIQMDGDEV